MRTFADVPGRGFFSVIVGRSGGYKWYYRMVDANGNKSMEAVGLEDSQIVSFSNDQSVLVSVNHWQLLNVLQEMFKMERFSELMKRLSTMSVFGDSPSSNGRLSKSANGRMSFTDYRISDELRLVLASGEPIFGEIGGSY